MTGRILVVDDVATNRIVMKVKLAAACYAVDQADCGTAALIAARANPPDLILLDVVMPDMSGLEVCRKLKADPETADIPVILITALADRESKMAGLEAGADDFLTKPVDEVTLLARVRSLLRARETARELKHRGDPALGFAEAAAGFSAKEKPGRIALIAPGPKGAVLWKTALDDRVGGEVSILPRDAALSSFGVDDADAPDVFVIAADLSHRNEGLRLLSDLRSRPATRHAATVMILPGGDSERAAIALDLGAHDILYDPFDPQELAIRIRAQLGHKRQADRLRASLQVGLEMAVTDSLTGLHNRRYGLFELDRMLARQGQRVGVMLLDIDHFKQVNDTHGHSVGDKVLNLVARRLRAQLRGGDLLARIGGEEFLVALPECDRATALDCAERLRAAVADQPFAIGGGVPPLSVTLSVGIALAGTDTDETAQSLIDRADAALYGAKAHGRDQVTLSTLPAA
ncbi:diguanylate cyclase domain-containing protein [Roseicyclus mahoneyensis]|uniref:diguanylate cyclase n=1 Tax=Roseicyclus mahoneyensis TaxID=164332 RepID=A0A316GJF8_9RHOB|nr:diguanylate cyclase [Roseicyclus mahoneyensis]PWK60674.1 response regulator receiver modulated diguanylate cyclase [Roseicyclus mahoneyensis]